jgi:hypothetical protein
VDRSAVWTNKPRRTGAVGVAGAMLWLGGCSDASDPRRWEQVPVTLAWDQPDQLAEYFTVRVGRQLRQVSESRATLLLAPGAHTVEIESCNGAGCSASAVVVVVWRNGRWEIVQRP